MEPNTELKEISNSLPSPIALSTVSKPRTKHHPSCDICGLIFYKEYELKKHMEEPKRDNMQGEINDNSFKCSDCSIFFKSERGYKQHVVKIHSDRHMHLKCAICKKKFKNKSSMKFHKKQAHLKEIKRDCPLCGKEFYNKYLLPKHIEKCKLNLSRGD